MRRRIQAVKNTQKITKAMKMVSSARLKRAEDRVLTVRPYMEHLERMYMRFGETVAEELLHPLAEVRPEVKRIGILVISSDRGLCGSYNTNLFRAVHDFAEKKKKETVLYVIGRKGADYFRRRHWNIAARFINLSFHIEYREIKNVVDVFSGAFLSGDVDEVWLAYSRYVAAAISRPAVVPLLPLVPPEHEEKVSQVKFIFQPSVKAIVDVFFPKYLHTRVVAAFAEAMASEQGQRMVAMTAATDNAEEMVQSLTLYYNKARQAAITKEIMEVVGGAEALK
ncbi:MAG: ATP synthase F1 subunit gamma [bacterium]